MALEVSAPKLDFHELVRQIVKAHETEVALLQDDLHHLQRQCCVAELDKPGPAASETADAARGDLPSHVQHVELDSEMLCHTVSTTELRNSDGAKLCSPIVRKLRHAVESVWFEGLVSSAIFVNALVLAVEAQCRGLELASDLGFQGSNLSSESVLVFSVVENTFGVFFLLELLVRLSVFGLAFMWDAWNWLDASIVIFWSLGRFIALPVNSQVLRVVRLCRLLRLLRLVRRIQQFDALFLITMAIRSSVSILSWTAGMLLILQMLFALLMNQVLFSFYFDNISDIIDDAILEQKADVFRYFGTFSRSLLTLFEMTLANWPPVCRLLVDNVSEWFMPFCIMHKVTMGFAVIGVINGVLMQETFKVASNDNAVMIRNKQRSMALYAQKFRHFFREADTSGDGRMDLDEFSAVMKHEELRVWLAACELDVTDVRAVFNLLDYQGDGKLTAEEFIKGVLHLKGSARSLDLLTMQKDQRALKLQLDKLVSILGDRSAAPTEGLQDRATFVPARAQHEFSI
eukprot:TRINITY_DN29036_c0_g1_i1.p1 TRINITY_DN29036_c0_g1~~TRINITY_DN29036_c0_g1_i1.p1  ORF type:complete len:530 (+),score=82.72 TRINITY_DN29036_c0_g1_i1:44-1591(+)